MQKIISKIYWVISSQFGINPRKFIYSFLGMPRYIRDFFSFRKKYRGDIELIPCLHDWFEEGGTTSTEYFWQDLYIAQKINQASPSKHVDIGSRVDGFVAHVASYREIEIFDIRQISSTIPNVIFKQADLMKSVDGYSDYCDSLSCLHALEHFGLGRYKDEINVDGYKLGLANMVRMLKKGGTFYLSTPVGKQKVAFNAHRIFNPGELKTILNEHGLELKEFAWFAESKGICDSVDIEADFARLSQMPYALGIFTFVKQ